MDRIRTHPATVSVTGLLIAAALVVGSIFATGLGGASAGRGHISVPDGVYGGSVMATVNPGGDGTWAHAECSQDGSVVYAQYVQVGADNTAMFTLGPTPSWTGGDADCVAEELVYKNGRFRSVASTTFHASGQ